MMFGVSRPHLSKTDPVTGELVEATFEEIYTVERLQAMQAAIPPREWAWWVNYHRREAGSHWWKTPAYPPPGTFREVVRLANGEWRYVD